MTLSACVDLCGPDNLHDDESVGESDAADLPDKGCVDECVEAELPECELLKCELLEFELLEYPPEPRLDAPPATP